MRRRSVALVFAALVGQAALTGCSATTHATQPSALGAAKRSADLLAVIDQPGPIESDAVVACDWAVKRSGVLNLDSPRAKQAGLKDEDEPVQVFFHVIKHPRFGTFLIDTGVEVALRDAPAKAAMRGLVASEMHIEKMRFQNPLGDWLKAHPEPIRGVFFTHIHVDHVAGAPDLPKSTPIYTGPGEASEKGGVHFFTQSNIDRALDGLPPISEWGFRPDADGRFEGVLDVFGDGSFWALYTPGHTRGSTSYVARTAKGAVLFTGDTSHTRWGWQNEVEPGGFTSDHEANLKSLIRLKRLATEHPTMEVRLGHQSFREEIKPTP